MCKKEKNDDDNLIYLTSIDPETGWRISEFVTQEEYDDMFGEPGEVIEKYDPDDDY